MDFALYTDNTGRPQASLDGADALHNAILLSLSVKRGSFFLNPNFGSRLHDIHATSAADVALARQYAMESLLWMVDVKLVNSIDVSVSARRGGILAVDIAVQRAGNSNNSYSTFFKVV